MSAGPRDEIDALAAETAKTSAFLHGLAPDDWERATRCPPWRVREVVVHMLMMLRYMGETAAAPPQDAEPVKDRVSWWDYDIAEDQAETADWIAKATLDLPDGPLIDEWRETVDAAVPAVSAALADGDPVVQPGELPVRLSDYAATRVLEITIHSMDVRDALGREPDPSAEGLGVTLGILERRLGADPVALGFEGVDFVLLSTGRRALTDEDRSRLGTSTAKLPLLA